MAKKETLINNMTEGRVVRQLVTFAVPYMLASLLQTVYSMVDMLVVGQFSGEVALAAVSVGSQVVTFFTMLGIGFSSGVQVMIAQYVGGDDLRSVSRTVGTAAIALGVAAIVLGGACIGFAVPLLHLMNAPDASFGAAVAYMRTCGAGMLFIYGYNVVSSILRGMGDSKRPLIFIAIAAVVNIVLDLVLVAVCGLGAFGAAIATVAGQSIAFLWALYYLYRNRSRLGFEFHLSDLRVHGKTLKAMMRLGFPMALQTAAITLSCMIVNSYIYAFGVTAAAITGVGQKLTNLVCVIPVSISNALATLVGQNMAAGKPDRVKKLVHTGLFIALAITLTVSVLFLLFPRGVFGLFNRSPELLDMTPGYMPILVVGFIASAIMGPYYGVVNGIGNAGLSLFIGLMDGVVARVGLALLFGIALNFGIRGFWMGDAFAPYVTGILSVAYFISGKWKTYKLLKDR